MLNAAVRIEEPGGAPQDPPAMSGDGARGTPVPRTVRIEDNGEATYNSFNRRYEYLGRQRKKPLVPTMLSDVMSHCLVYLLGLTVTVLCVVKIIQVQDTRQLTAQLNEVNLNIESLTRENLLLQAQRQSLAAHSTVREQAVLRLGMINPKTEAEIVIRLDN